MTGDRFEPWERFMMLDRVLEDLPDGPAWDVTRIVTRTAMVVVRQVMGKVTAVEAYAHIERARREIEAIRKGLP